LYGLIQNYWLMLGATNCPASDDHRRINYLTVSWKLLLQALYFSSYNLLAQPSPLQQLLKEKAALITRCWQLLSSEAIC
jgi:hypothetical protein